MQFCGVIGQNGELINGDFVELNTHYEVRITKFNAPVVHSSLKVMPQFFFITTDEVWDFVDKLQTIDGSCLPCTRPRKCGITTWKSHYQ